MRVLVFLVTALALIRLPAQAQVLGFDGDGFEACPHQVLVNVSTSSWTTTFGSFPSVPGVNHVLVPASGSAAFQFLAPAATSGTLRVQNDPSVTGQSVISIARCGSVFPVNPQTCLRGPELTPTLDFTTDAHGTGCVLEPGQIYYFNITFGVDTVSVPGQPWCSSGSCAVSVNSLLR